MRTRGWEELIDVVDIIGKLQSGTSSKGICPLIIAQEDKTTGIFKISKIKLFTNGIINHGIQHVEKLFVIPFLIECCFNVLFFAIQGYLYKDESYKFSIV